MHIAFIARGIKNAQEHLFMDMQAQKYPLVVTKADGTKQEVLVQGALRPIQLYEYVFPKEHLDVVYNSLKPEMYPNTMKMKALVNSLRMSMGFQKPPKYEASGAHLAWVNKDISIIPIGIKEDSEIVYPDGTKHEAL